tara:strand:- start:989 stop:1192 length:204 start_codon:yes stop_codon:yes gene_type:complete
MNGAEIPLDNVQKAQYDEAYATLGGMGERVFGFAQLYLDPNVYGHDYEFDIEVPRISLFLRFHCFYC